MAFLKKKKNLEEYMPASASALRIVKNSKPSKNSR